MDYNFISVGDFRILEESGLLLESGTYDGEKPAFMRGCTCFCSPFTPTALDNAASVSSTFTVIMTYSLP